MSINEGLRVAASLAGARAALVLMGKTIGSDELSERERKLIAEEYTDLAESLEEMSETPDEDWATDADREEADFKTARIIFWAFTTVSVLVGYFAGMIMFWG